VELIPEIAQQARDRYGLDVLAVLCKRPIILRAILTSSLCGICWSTFTIRWAACARQRACSNRRLLAFSTVLADALDARLFGRYWVGYEIPRHLYVFQIARWTRCWRRMAFKSLTSKCCTAATMLFPTVCALRCAGGSAALDTRWRVWLAAQQAVALADGAVLQGARSAQTDHAVDNSVPSSVKDLGTRGTSSKKVDVAQQARVTQGGQ